MVHKKEVKPKIFFAVGGVNVSPEEFRKQVTSIFSKVHLTSGYEMEMTEKGMKKKKRLF
jgi:hypothetical protein